MSTPSSNSALGAALDDARRLGRVGEQVGEAGEEADRAGVDRLPDRLGVGEGEIGRRDGVQILLGEEFDPGAGALVQPFRFLDHLERALGGEQIGLLEIVEDRLLAPGGIVEAAVAALGRGDGIGGLAGGARGGGLPQLQPVGGGLLLRLDQLAGMGPQMRGELAEGARRGGGVEGLGDVGIERPGGGAGGEMDGVGDHLRPGFGEVGRAGQGFGELEDGGGGVGHCRPLVIPAKAGIHEHRSA